MSGERLYLVGEKPVAPLIWHTIKSGSSAVGIGPARLRENVAQSVSAKSQYETDPTQRLQAATLRLWCAIGAHGAALHGWPRHSLSGRDPQEGDDEDADNSFGRSGFGSRRAHVAPAQARRGPAPVAGGGPGDPLARTGRHGRDPERMAAHLRLRW